MYTSTNENFEQGYPHSNALLQSHLKFECCKPHKVARHLTKCDVIIEVKLFPTVYSRQYVAIFLRYPIRHRITNSSALESIIINTFTEYYYCNEKTMQADEIPLVAYLGLPCLHLSCLGDARRKGVDRMFA